MHKLVLIRHGESDWNKQNRFTGWTDVDLSERGLAEASLHHWLDAVDHLSAALAATADPWTLAANARQAAFR